MLHARTTPAIAFAGAKNIGHGPLEHVALAAKAVHDLHGDAPLLVFEAETSRPIDLDFRGTQQDVLARLEDIAPAKPGRPKLGVTAREITLLPRHWDWLATQPGGASVALRKLVEAARHTSGGRDRQRAAQEATYRFMSAMAGDYPGFEEASRALFAGDNARFATLLQDWPGDVREHCLRLAEAATL